MRHEVARRTGPSFDRLDVNVRRSQRSVNDSGGLRAAWLPPGRRRVWPQTGQPGV